MAIQIREANLIANRITEDLETSNEQLAVSMHEFQILKYIDDLAKKNKEFIAIIESQNRPVDTHKNLEAAEFSV